MRMTIVALCMLATHPLCAAELTLDQQLILACYKLEVGQVVSCLRKGANVNARFRKRHHADFVDRWTGAQGPFGLDSWTPLIALAGSREYPDPPPELGDIWKDPARSEMMRQQLPQERVEGRRKDAMIILYILLSHNCNLEHHDGYGATALYEAIDNNKVSLAKTLLEFGANPNVRVQAKLDGPGDLSPLHAACRSQKLLQLLLDYGADASAKDSEGLTPADWIGWDEDRKFDLVKSSNGWRIRPRAQPPGNLGSRRR